MSDRYTFHEDSPREEDGSRPHPRSLEAFGRRVLEILERNPPVRSAGGSADMTIREMRVRPGRIGHQVEAAARDVERIQGHEDTPLRLTDSQRARLLDLLSEEIGPVSAQKLLERIEREV